jgi:hypothetical protein
MFRKHEFEESTNGSEMLGSPDTALTHTDEFTINQHVSQFTIGEKTHRESS